MNTATITIVLLYAAAGILSIALAPLYVVNELALFESPESPLNIVYLMFSVIVVFIIVMIITKLQLEKLLKGLFYFSAFTLMFITISLILPDSIPWLIVSILVSASILVMLDRFYKWYMVDSVGILLSSSIAAWFGASLSPMLLVVLLVLMAVYDYFAVKSGGMISLAETTLKMNLPTMIMSPMKEIPEELKDREGERRGALLGLGDIAFPNMLTVATYFNTSSAVVGGVSLNLIAAMLVLSGGIVGLLIVLFVVRRFKRPQPGLPYIGLGAVLAWLASRLLF